MDTKTRRVDAAQEPEQRREEAERVVCDAINALLTIRHRKAQDLGAYLGMDKRAISRRLNGHVPFDAADVKLAAEFFEVTVAALFTAPDSWHALNPSGLPAQETLLTDNGEPAWDFSTPSKPFSIMDALRQAS